jgi:hypothetical protein
MSEQNKPEENGANPGQSEEEQKAKSRRDFLRSLGRWSAIIIGGVTLGGMMAGPGDADAAGWINGGGGWVNARGGRGSAGWVNRGGGGTAGWVNGGGGGAGWVNRGGGWINGGGAGWINRRGSWINRF